MCQTSRQTMNYFLPSILQVKGEDIYPFQDWHWRTMQHNTRAHICKIHNKASTPQTNMKLTAYRGTQVPIKQKCQMTTKLGSKAIDVEFYAVEINMPWSGTNQHKHHRWSQGKSVRSTYTIRDVFTGLGLVKDKYHIKLLPDAKPTIHPLRIVPLSLYQNDKKHLRSSENKE